MIERFSGYIADRLIRIGTAQEEERPFLIYGLFCLQSGFIQISLLFVCSLLFHNGVILTALYAAFFGVLKRTIGGWHANHHITCLALFTTLSVVCVQIAKHCPASALLPCTLIVAMAMVGIVWMAAPVEHQNNPQSQERLAELKRISRMLAGIEFILITGMAILFYNAPLGQYPLAAAFGSFTASFSLLVPNTPGEGR